MAVRNVTLPHHYGNSHAIWDNTVLPAEVTSPPLPPAEAGNRFSDPGGMQD